MRAGLRAGRGIRVTETGGRTRTRRRSRKSSASIRGNVVGMDRTRMEYEDGNIVRLNAVTAPKAMKDRDARG